MQFITDYAIENFILNAQWDDFPIDIQQRLICCSIDLMSALIIGSKGRQYNTGVTISKRLGLNGDIPILGSDIRLNLLGASIAYSHAANSFDIDDGYNMVKGHPGASFIGGVLAAALEKNCSYKEYLTTLLICYETAIRWGLAEQDYYGFLHSTGAYGSFGTAAGIGRLHQLDQKKLNNALSIADYHAPMTPVMRAVEYPSMNKDGVPFGSLIGTMAVIETEEGETGRTHLLELPQYRFYIDSLSKKYYIQDLYFKPYTCCRWAHQPITACISLMRKNRLKHTEIKKVIVHTFRSAAQLSQEIPSDTDEAQYNIAFPVAAAIVKGDVGYDQINDTAIHDPIVLNMMRNLSFVVDPAMEREFPEKRMAWVEIQTKDNNIYTSSVYEAPGEHTDPSLNLSWFFSKFERITSPALSGDDQKKILSMFSKCSELTMQELLVIVNNSLKTEYKQTRE